MDLSQSVGACLVCRSTRYHKTDDGFLICEFGHQSQSFWEEQEDKDTYFGATRKISKSTKPTRLSQVLNSQDTTDQIFKSGDVEFFSFLEVIQILIKAQLEAVKNLVPSPAGFEDVVKSVWLKYVSALNFTYTEEIVGDNPTASQVQTNGRKDDTNPDLSEDDFFEVPNGPEALLPFNGKLRLAIVIPIMALSCCYTQIPLFTCDIYKMILTGKLPYVNVLSIVPTNVQQSLHHRQLALLSNPNIPDAKSSGTAMIVLGKLMHQKYGIYLPRIDCKILFWRIGEELSLPYFYRKTLVLMSLKLKIDPVVGLLHEKHPANPLISAFVLAIFFLKLNYGLLDRDSCRVNADFKKSGFPCLEELGLLWKRKLSSISTPFSFDPTEFKNFLEFCQKDVIKPLGNKGEISEAELDPIKRLVQSSTWDSSSLAATPEELSPWLLNIIRFDDLGSKIIPPDFWARNFVVVPKINDPIGSDYFQSLLQIGAYFCSSDTESLLAVYERLFTTNVAFETLKALFSS